MNKIVPIPKKCFGRKPYKTDSDGFDSWDAIITMHQYEQQNNVRITEEEVTNIFGESYLYPNYILENGVWDTMTDYEYYEHEQQANLERKYLDFKIDLGQADSIEEGEIQSELQAEIESRFSSTDLSLKGNDQYEYNAIIDGAKFINWNTSLNIEPRQQLILMLRVAKYFKLLYEQRHKPYGYNCSQVSGSSSGSMNAIEGEIESQIRSRFQKSSEYELNIPILFQDILCIINGDFNRVDESSWEWYFAMETTFRHNPYCDGFNEEVLDKIIWPLYRVKHNSMKYGKRY